MKILEITRKNGGEDGIVGIQSICRIVERIPERLLLLLGEVEKSTW